MKKLRTQYKAKLSKFDGNSVEYREWLALLVADHGIPGIEKTYDITKLLRRLNIDYLKKLKGSLNGPARTIEKIQYLQPYLYHLATSDIEDLDYRPPTLMYSYINAHNPEYKAFETALNDLHSKIKNVLEEKGGIQ